MSTSYKVVGTWGAQKHPTELGEFATVDEAMDRVDRWQGAPEVRGMHIDFIEVIRVTHTTVYSANTAPSDCGEDGSDGGETQEQYGIEALQKTVWKLEDRHVGLRNDVMLDIDHVYEKIAELRDDMSKEIVAARRDVTMDVMNSDSDIRALKNEVEVLRREMESLREESSK